jgi:hypothetical protein
MTSQLPHVFFFWAKLATRPHLRKGKNQFGSTFLHLFTLKTAQRDL